MPSLPKQDPRLDAFRDAAMEFDAVYGLLAKSCGLSDPEYWSLVLIKEGIVTANCQVKCNTSAGEANRRHFLGL